MKENRLHTISVLRRIAGIKQTHLAYLTDVSEVTLQKIESGSRKLSRKLADRISVVTGVSSDWLLSCSPNTDPVNTLGYAYSKSDYELLQTESTKFVLDSEIFMGPLSVKILELIEHILISAKDAGKLALAERKLLIAMSDICAELKLDPADPKRGLFGGIRGDLRASLIRIREHLGPSNNLLSLLDGPTANLHANSAEELENNHKPNQRKAPPLRNGTKRIPPAKKRRPPLNS